MFSAARILAIRKSKGYSQELLAEQSGVSLRTVQRVEQGETVPRGHTLQALATALGVTLDDFRPEPTTPAVPALAPLTAPELLPTSTPVGLRADPQFLQLLNLSALSFLALPLLNIVVPLLLWRARRHEVAHVADIGRRVVGFQVLWQVGCFFAYLLLVLVHWVAARYYHLRIPGTFLVLLVVSYLLNVLVIGRNALRLRRGNLSVYRVWL
ncbi:helix-turn-helix domain-containing protein [Hymenobacter busanensis]|uniref:Helix-turn-helix domain-containing protein n=1 Tax=Hymenobacter busanensis TaxID=2607656 RepID=A0A7L4ZTR6_9BACT|nr:helix-turn-helix domain-containing protein [Hymenobacter busanensis]KAA9339728.1 helix-turn-helix domain-containing protein [Hymenobacter busanensis]QHJ06518.1 helix-turn-helix domain-containing protein [Hymenobacter busanensis]